jgi:hypothetical protein
VFMNMFENKMLENVDGILRLEDMCGEAVEFLLRHIYTGSLHEITTVSSAVFIEVLNASTKVHYFTDIFPIYSLLLSVIKGDFVDNFSTNFQS